MNEARLLPFSAGMVRLWAGRCWQLSGTAVLPADALVTFCYITATMQIVGEEGVAGGFRNRRDLALFNSADFS